MNTENEFEFLPVWKQILTELHQIATPVIKNSFYNCDLEGDKIRHWEQQIRGSFPF